MFSLRVSLIDRIFWIWEAKLNIIAIIVCSLSPLSPSFAFLSSSSSSLHCFFVYRISWPGSADTSCGLFKNSGLSAMHYCIEYEYHCHKYDHHNFHLQRCAWNREEYSNAIFNFAFRFEKSWYILLCMLPFILCVLFVVIRKMRHLMTNSQSIFSGCTQHHHHLIITDLQKMFRVLVSSDLPIELLAWHFTIAPLSDLGESESLI